MEFRELPRRKPDLTDRLGEAFLVSIVIILNSGQCKKLPYGRTVAGAAHSNGCIQWIVFPKNAG